MLAFYFRFRFLRLRHHRHVILHLPAEFCQNRTIRDTVITSYPFFKMAATASQFYFWLRFSWLCSDGKVDIYILNFGEISQSTAETLLLPVSENKRPPCWNSNSGSDFYVWVTIGMSFCICLSNFVQIGHPRQFLWRHIHFSRWRPRHRNATSGFGFPDFAQMWRLIYLHSKISARYLNPRLRYYYFRFMKTNVCHVRILLPVIRFSWAHPFLKVEV